MTSARKQDDSYWYLRSLGVKSTTEAQENQFGEHNRNTGPKRGCRQLLCARLSNEVEVYGRQNYNKESK